jgi:hypothetical protein
MDLQSSHPVHQGQPDGFRCKCSKWDTFLIGRICILPARRNTINEEEELTEGLRLACNPGTIARPFSMRANENRVVLIQTAPLAVVVSRSHGAATSCILSARWNCLLDLHVDRDALAACLQTMAIIDENPINRLCLPQWGEVALQISVTGPSSVRHSATSAVGTVLKNRPHSLQVRFASLAAIAGNDAAAAVRIARIRVRDDRVIGDCGTKCDSIRSAAQLA